MARVLITGGAGFVGSHTADALIEKGHTVRILDLLDPQIHTSGSAFPSYVNPAAECIRGDIRDYECMAGALEGIGAVYHLAALTGVGQSMYDLGNYVDTNATGTAVVLEAIIKQGRPLRRLVLASSRAVYGEGTHSCPVHGITYPAVRRREDMERGEFGISCPVCATPLTAAPTEEIRPLRPISMYALTKRQQEELCQYVAQTFSLPVTILRYFNVYGSRQSLKNPYTGIVSIFYSRMKAEQPISIYEQGTPGRDFVHISDVVKANVLALDADVPPGTCINVGSGTEVSVSDVARALAQACDVNPELRVTGDFRVGDIHSCYANLDAARRLLSYAPKIGLNQGMQEFMAWAKDQESVDLYQKSAAELERYGLFGHTKPSGG